MRRNRHIRMGRVGSFVDLYWIRVKFFPACYCHRCGRVTVRMRVVRVDKMEGKGN